MSGRGKRTVGCLRSMAVVISLLLAATLAQASSPMKQDDTVKLAEVNKEMDEALRTIKAYTIDKKNEAMAEAKKVLDRMDSRIDELENQSSEKWQRMSKNSQEQRQETLRELRKKRNEIAEWYGGMRQSSMQAWDEVKEGFAKSYHALREAYDQAAEKF